MNRRVNSTHVKTPMFVGLILLFDKIKASACIVVCVLMLPVLAKAQSTNLVGATDKMLAWQLQRWMEEFASIPQPQGLDSLGSYQPGWINNINFRTETNRFEASRQRYAMRFKPKTPNVRKAESRLQQVQRQDLLALGEEARTEAYAAALSKLFELATHQQELIYIDTLILVQKKLVEATRVRVSEPNFDIEKVLEAEDDLVALNLRKRDISLFDQQHIPPIPLTKLVSLVDIRNNLIALEAKPNLIYQEKTKLDKIDAEEALERAENLAIIDFFSLEFDPRQLTPRQQYNIGASLNLPAPTRNNRAIDKLKVERLEERYKAQLEKQVKEREFLEQIQLIKNDISRWSALRDVIADRNVRRRQLMEVYLNSARTGAEAIIQLKRSNIRDLLDLLSIEEDIRKGYAELLGKYIELDEDALLSWVLTKGNR